MREKWANAKISKNFLNSGSSKARKPKLNA